jgi:hypothetical protein
MKNRLISGNREGLRDCVAAILSFKYFTIASPPTQADPERKIDGWPLENQYCSHWRETNEERNAARDP